MSSSSSSSSDSSDSSDELEKKIVTNYPVKPIIFVENWPLIQNLSVNEFQTHSEDIDAHEYFKIVYTDAYEKYYYKESGIGDFESKGGIKEIPLKELNINNDIDFNKSIGRSDCVIHREVKIIPATKILEKFSSFLNSDTTPFTYVTTQKKLCNKMQFTIQFDDYWSEYFSHVGGIVSVDYIDPQNKKGTIQNVVMSAKISLGWGVNTIAEKIFSFVIQNEMQNMMDITPKYLEFSNIQKIK